MGDANLLDAAARGTREGLQLALEHRRDAPELHRTDRACEPRAFVRAHVAPEILASFSPAAWLLGVPWSESMRVGGLLGTRTILNELVAFGIEGGGPFGAKSRDRFVRSLRVREHQLDRDPIGRNRRSRSGAEDRARTTRGESALGGDAGELPLGRDCRDTNLMNIIPRSPIWRRSRAAAIRGRADGRSPSVGIVLGSGSGRIRRSRRACRRYSVCGDPAFPQAKGRRAMRETSCWARFRESRSRCFRAGFTITKGTTWRSRPCRSAS